MTKEIKLITYLIIKKTKNKFGRLKKNIYLCKTINGGRKFRDESPTPVRKEEVH